MRNWEALAWVVVTVWTVWWIVRPPERWIRWGLALGSFVVLGLQALLEGARFHLAPIYVLGAVMTVLLAWRARGWARALLGIPLTLLVALGVVLPAVFPVFSYDPPAGKFGVGTTVYEVHDSARTRDLAIQVWYPTVLGARGPIAAITTRPELLKDAYGRASGLPGALFDNLRLIRTHAVMNAPLPSGKDRYPVVLFSHGPIAANRSQSIFQMEALASHGFVVVAIDHVGASSVTVFPDGRTTPVDPRVKWPVFVDDDSRALVEHWVRDVHAVIDRLEALDSGNSSDMLAGRLALDRIGYVGASFGGSVVVQALLEEPRLKAGVAEDGKPYFFDRTLSDLRRPLLYLRSDLPYIPVSDERLASWGITPADFASAKRDHYARLERLIESVRAPFYDVLIRGTDHVSFSDLHLIVRTPAPHLTDQRRAHQIINAYTIDFLERYLNGGVAPLSDGHTPPPYSDVTARARNVSTQPLAKNLE